MRKALMPDYSELRQSLAVRLREDARSHREGRFTSIGQSYWDLDHAAYKELKSDDPLLIAHAFWDSWADARNHDWQFYPGIGQDDWPKLAEYLAVALEQGNPVEERVLRDLFVPRQRQRSVKWWKAIGGALLVCVNLKNMLAPAPNLLKPDNDAQQVGMIVAYLGMIVWGAWLLFSGLNPLWRRRI
jgi:hypothetical protein